MDVTNQNIHLARWWQEADHNRLLCTLCPRYCKIGEGQAGFCYIRKNIDGKLYSLGYGRPTGFAIDPIEKKPLNHFLPGTGILSFGTAGCNLGCKFCQNWTMSKAHLDEVNSLYASPEQVVELAKKHQVPSIAYTYNDPIIFGEYVIDISRLAREEHIRSVMVTNGYIDTEARKEVFRYVDGANVDLKAFTERFYSKLTLSHLAPVLDTLKWLVHETDVWVEITTLLIPGENDSDEELKQMIDWILSNLGADIPIHFTAFHPSFRMLDHPPTPHSTLTRAREIAINAGMHYCYVGNVRDVAGQTTFCPNCHTPLIERDWHSIYTNHLKDGHCVKCGQEIPGVWK